MTGIPAMTNARELGAARCGHHVRECRDLQRALAAALILLERAGEGDAEPVEVRLARA
ncbi:MAG: hypothetical protein ACXWYB_13045 [Aeromicrobium sp.]